MTMFWQGRSTACSRLTSFTGAVRGATLELPYATLEGVVWFNNRRLQGPFGNIPPAEAEAKNYAALERIRHRRMTKTTQPLANPARFNEYARYDLHCCKSSNDKLSM